MLGLALGEEVFAKCQQRGTWRRALPGNFPGSSLRQVPRVWHSAKPRLRQVPDGGTWRSRRQGMGMDAVRLRQVPFFAECLALGEEAISPSAFLRRVLGTWRSLLRQVLASPRARHLAKPSSPSARFLALGELWGTWRSLGFL